MGGENGRIVVIVRFVVYGIVIGIDWVEMCIVVLGFVKV